MQVGRSRFTFIPLSPREIAMNLAYVLVAAVAMGAEAQEEKAPPPPEMKVLRQLVGNWTSEVKAEIPEETQSTETARTQLTLGGRYIQSRAFNEKGELTGITMYTYHVPSKQYRVWHFGSGGVAADGNGKWDVSTQTFTFTGGMDAGGTWKYTLHFADKKSSQSDFIAKDSEGEEVFKAQFKSTRQPRKGKKVKKQGEILIPSPDPGVY